MEDQPKPNGEDLQEQDILNIKKFGYSNNLIDEPLKGSYVMTDFPDPETLPF